jgi:hypothetical protein
LTRRNIIRVLISICVLSLCANAYIIVRAVSQRASDYKGMSMVPNYLAAALVSYDLEFNKKDNPNVHFQPGLSSVQMAFSGFQASEPLYSNYDYHTDYVYYFLSDLMNSSDTTIYRELSDIKSYLPNRFIKPSEIQPLFNAIAREYTKIHDIK